MSESLELHQSENPLPSSDDATVVVRLAASLCNTAETQLPPTFWSTSAEDRGER